MAKIGSLQVDTIKIGNTALTGTVQSTYNHTSGGVGTITSISLPEGNPVLLFWTCVVELKGSGPSPSITLQIQVRRTSGTAAVLFTRSQTTNATTYIAAWNGSVMDRSPGSSPSYDIYKTVTGSSGTSNTSGTLLGEYVKK